MATYTAPIEVFNTALLITGEDVITANDSSAEATLFRGIYEPYVRAAMTRHSWKWARDKQLLTYQGTSGTTPKYVYVLPNDFLIAHKITIDEAFVGGWEQVVGPRIHADFQVDDAYIHYTRRVDENLWPADFAAVIVKKMEGYIRRAILRDMNDADQCDKDAEEMLLDAIGRARNAEPAPQHENRPPLVSAWQGGVRRA